MAATHSEHLAPVAKLQFLLLAAEPAAGRVSQVLSTQLAARVTVAQGLRACMEALNEQVFDVLLLEESVALENEAALQVVYDGAGAALVLELNFALSNADRVLRQVRYALQRRAVDERRIAKALKLSLTNDLNATISGLLLESQMALRKAGTDVSPALEHFATLAEALCDRLRE